jgi:hypothetical protein
METLLDTYSLSDIILFIALLASAIMGAGKFIEWSFSKLKRFFGKNHVAQKKEDELNRKLKQIDTRQTNAEDALKEFSDLVQCLSDKVEILVDSDKDSIKAYLTDKHHYYTYAQGWIDDYNLDCIERRYVHYKKAGGNSFVDHLMEDLRLLPTQPPSDNER